ncbi:MAG: hypothetical protein HYV63_18070 [Candidatus Schekmanbacteria bacterium]|nr:hypothetical protein [Candidatus Schekmanbacteria bacterium]
MRLPWTCRSPLGRSLGATPLEPCRRQELALAADTASLPGGGCMAGRVGSQPRDGARHPPHGGRRAALAVGVLARRDKAASEQPARLPHDDPPVPLAARHGVNVAPGAVRGMGSAPRGLQRAAAAAGLRLAGVGLAVVLALAAAPGRAASSRWTPMGPSGGTLRSVAVDPTNPTLLYASGPTRTGIFSSMDGGSSWRHATTALLDLSVLDLGVDAGGTVWARAEAYGEAGLLRSTDRGSTWGFVHVVPPADRPYDVLTSLVLDPRSPGTLYVTSEGSDEDEDRKGVFRSTDQGATWNRILRYCPPTDTPTVVPIVVAVDPTDSRALYATTSNGLCKSTDGGGSWSFTDMGIPSGRMWRGGEWAIDPAAPLTIHAAIYNWGYARSTDGGATWAHQSPLTPVTGSAAGDITRIVLDPASPATLYTTGTFGLYRSRDGGATWTFFNDLACGVPRLAILPDKPGGLVGVGISGLCRSFDWGATWAEVEAGLHNDYVNYVLADSDRPVTVYAGGNSSKLLRTTDGGTTWSRLGGDLFDQWPEPLASGGEPGTIYVRSNGLFRSRDDGATWTRLDTGGCIGGGGEPAAVAIDPGDPTRLLAGLSYADLCRSTDAGASWARVNLPETTGSYLGEIAFDPSRTQDVYLSIRGTVPWKSTDGGSNWAPIATGIEGYEARAFAADPFAAGVVLMSGGSRVIPQTSEGGVLRSTDGGATWADASAGLPIGAGRPASPLDLLADPIDQGTFYAAVSSLDKSGVYRSTDGGMSWALLNMDGLYDTHVGVLAVSPVSPRRLYVASGGWGDGNGIFFRDLPPTAPVPALAPAGVAAALLAALCLRRRRAAGGVFAGGTDPANEAWRAGVDQRRVRMRPVDMAVAGDVDAAPACEAPFRGDAPGAIPPGGVPTVREAAHRSVRTART